MHQGGHLKNIYIYLFSCAGRRPAWAKPWSTNAGCSTPSSYGSTLSLHFNSCITKSSQNIHIISGVRINIIFVSMYHHLGL
jgi:hypothetical protein